MNHAITASYIQNLISIFSKVFSNIYRAAKCNLKISN